MKKLLAMFAVLGLTALLAAYVALAPLAPSGPEGLNGLLNAFDANAARISEIAGRNMAVLALLGGGLVLGLILAVFVGPGSAREVADGLAPAPGPVWRPHSHDPEDRIASLRRRAGMEEAEQPVAEPTAPESSDDPGDEAFAAEADIARHPPRPVILARKVRERGADWTGSASWLGGLPRLAGLEWPRDPQGRPLPFAAQVDLAELAAACPESPLPHQGSLAFFLGTGAVVAVPPGAHEFTAPPPGLPASHDEDGYPLPAKRTRLSRDLFPFWPVEPVALPLPEALLDHRDERLHEAIEQVMLDMVRERFGKPSPLPPTCNGGELWWYGVSHLADRVREAMDNSPQAIAMESQLEEAAGNDLAALEARSDALPDAVAGARGKVLDAQARRREIEEEAAALPAMVEALDGFMANRQPWEPLTAEERSLVVEILDEIHRRHGMLAQFHVPRSLAQLQTVCIRVMIADGPDAVAALPDDVLDRIAKEHRVPTLFQHQVFGLGGVQQSARDEHLEDLLLLQLGYDDMMEWRWGDMGLFQYWISPEDAAAARWDKAEMTFEMG